MPTQMPRARRRKEEDEEPRLSRKAGSQGVSACASKPSFPNTDASAPSVPASTLRGCGVGVGRLDWLGTRGGKSRYFARLGVYVPLRPAQTPLGAQGELLIRKLVRV